MNPIIWQRKAGNLLFLFFSLFSSFLNIITSNKFLSDMKIFPPFTLQMKIIVSLVTSKSIKSWIQVMKLMMLIGNNEAIIWMKIKHQQSMLVTMQEKSVHHISISNFFSFQCLPFESISFCLLIFWTKKMLLLNYIFNVRNYDNILTQREEWKRRKNRILLPTVYKWIKSVKSKCWLFTKKLIKKNEMKHHVFTCQHFCFNVHQWQDSIPFSLDISFQLNI